MKDVLVDVDDTICDTQIMLINTINERTGRNYEFDKMNRSYRETEEDMIWTQNVWDILAQPEMMATPLPSEAALEAMEELVMSGYRPHIVTARKAALQAVTQEWLRQHGFDRHVAEFHPRVVGESGVDFKVRIAKEVGFDAAFDDTHEVLVALAEHVPHVFMIDKPWNRGHDDELAPNVTRVSSFAEGVSLYLADRTLESYAA